MPTDHRARLATIKRFDQLIAYLRDEMGWPIARDSFDNVDDLFYDFTADELGIDPKTAAKIQEIKRLRPLSPKQPWGIFFIKFEPKKLPVVALRRILSQVALKKRASGNSAERAAWAADDLLFVSNYGEGDERRISFAHFSRAQDGHDLPTLKVLGWDNLDTALHLDAVARQLSEHLAWPEDEADTEAWRTRWRAAFTLRHREVVTTSKELSIRLADLARAIRDRIRTALTIETDKGPLTRLMKAFQEALVHDLDADGFADMYAQTIAYGLLSARIADPTRKTADDFAGHMRTNPFLRELMETFLKVGGRRGKAGGPGIDFDELGVSEVVELLDDAKMEAVVRDFGDRNPQEDPVIHFYEFFLKEYDAKKRMQRGVFYTPRPVVSYIVRSVDELLRTEFGLDDGLADTTTWAEMAKRHKDLKMPEGIAPDQDFVQILDPATGTGTFLVEVIDLIHRTLAAKWKAQGHGEKKINALWNEYVPAHLLTRLHGYELLMAPYAIAHLKIGLKLYETGYRFETDERARIYLTNALEPASDFSGTFEFAIPALAHEAQAVNEIKRHRRFTVIIGNPPYSSAAGATPTAFLADIMRPFTTGLGVESERKKGALQDDYIRFIALCRHIIACAGVGSVGLISNNSYLDGTLHRAMRKSLVEAFQRLLLVNLHGSSRAGGSGAKDENVFDIMQGVAILISARLWESRLAKPSITPQIRSADLIGTRVAKYATLAAGIVKLAELHPAPPYYLLRPLDRSLFEEYEAHVAVDEAFDVFSSGIETEKDHFAVDFSIEPLRQRLREFSDLSVSAKEVAAKYRLKSTPNWDLVESRTAIAKEGLEKDLFTRYLFHSFDWRYTYYSDYLVTRSRRPVMRHMSGDNVALVTLRQVKGEQWAHAFVTADISNKFTLSSKSSNVSYHFPLFLMEDDSKFPTLLENPSRRCNLSATTVDRFAAPRAIKPGTPIRLRTRTRHVFNYIYAVLHSPAYRVRYAEYLKLGFPRFPVSRNLELIRALASLGDELTALHLLESPKVNKPITEFIDGRNPEVEKVSWSKNTVWVDKGQTAGFNGVPEHVWNFRIGGYQVCHKWLKDRKGRMLSKDDIAHYQKIVVALAETIRLMKEIDEVIEQHGGWPGAFQTGETKAATAKVIPFRPRTVEPKPEERYDTCVPLVPLKAAAGAFSEPQHVEDDGFEWVAIESRHRLRPGMFVAQVDGKSMEPAIPDGAWCLFRAPVEGARQGKTVLVQLRDAADPETGQRYTVKRYESEKAAKGDSWRHERITLKPLNPDFEPIMLTGEDEGELQVIAELVEVLEGDATGEERGEQR